MNQTYRQSLPRAATVQAPPRSSSQAETLAATANALTMGGIFVLLFYCISYTALGDALRLPLQGLYFLLFIAGVALAQLVRPNPLGLLQWGGLVLIFVSTIFFTMTKGDVVELFRAFLGLALLTFAFVLTPNLSKTFRVVGYSVIALTPVVAAIALLGEGTFKRVDRLSNVVGEVGSFHPSAYLVLGMLLCLIAARPFMRINPLVLLGTGAILLVLLLGYKVRTTALILGVFTGAYLYLTLTAQFRYRAILHMIAAAILGLALVGTYEYLNSDIDIYQIGAGRGGTYAHRFELYMARDLLEQLIGTGPGSDYFRGSYTWQGAERDSHNDFLTLLLEQGMVGLMIVLSIFWAAAMRFSRSPAALSLLIAVAAGSAVSNSALFRPAVAPFYVLAMVMLYYATLKRSAARRSAIARASVSPAGPPRARQ